jgi:NDP-sugar pyrophosphorylase family protein
MAGGKGKRLAPVTDVIPKPLVPVRNKTMIEHIIDVFGKYGVNKFYITLNYKGKLIEAYFNSIERDYDVEFIWEEDFYGTAGSLKLLENKIEDNFIVSNCDILVNTDFYDLINFHIREKSLLTSITAIQHYKIPYGVVNTGKDGIINSIEEKPEYTFQINTGVYVLNRQALEYIPQNNYFDMPELIKQLIEKGKKVLAYPINESNYIDLGQWEEYKKNLGKLEEILKNV